MSDREEDEELENQADPNGVARSEKEIITTCKSLCIEKSYTHVFFIINYY